MLTLDIKPVFIEKALSCIQQFSLNEKMEREDSVE